MKGEVMGGKDRQGKGWAKEGKQMQSKGWARKSKETQWRGKVRKHKRGKAREGQDGGRERQGGVSQRIKVKKGKARGWHRRDKSIQGRKWEKVGGRVGQGRNKTWQRK